MPLKRRMATRRKTSIADSDRDQDRYQSQDRENNRETFSLDSFEEEEDNSDPEVIFQKSELDLNSMKTGTYLKIR